MGTFSKIDPDTLDVIRTFQEAKSEREAFELFYDADLTSDDLDDLVSHRGYDCGYGDPMIERYDQFCQEMKTLTKE